MNPKWTKWLHRVFLAPLIGGFGRSWLVQSENLPRPRSELLIYPIRCFHDPQNSLIPNLSYLSEVSPLTFSNARPLDRYHVFIFIDIWFFTGRCLLAGRSLRGLHRSSYRGRQHLVAHIFLLVA